MPPENDNLKRLKNELARQQENIDDLQHLLKEKSDKLVENEYLLDQYRQEINECRKDVINFQSRLEEQVNLKTEEKCRNLKSQLDEVESIKEQLRQEKSENQSLKDKLEQNLDIINQLRIKFKRLYNEAISKDIPLDEQYIDLDKLIDDRHTTIKNHQKLTSDFDLLQKNFETIRIENKLLRKMAKVPHDFIIQTEDIKDAEKKNTEDLYKQIKYMESEIEQLEIERAQLKFKLRDISTLYSKEPNERYNGLNNEQLAKLDDFAQNLRSGIEQPLNDKSKKLQDEVQKLKNQIEVYEKQNFSQFEKYLDQFKQQMSYLDNQTKSYGQSEQTISPDIIQQMNKQQEEIKKFLQDLVQNAPQTKSTNNYVGSDKFSMPPQPLQGQFGEIKEGYSHRFQQKIPIEQDAFYGQIGFDEQSAKYEISLLQLQNIESLKIIQIKDKELNNLNNEIVEIKEEMKRSLQIQDELFKKYFQENQIHQKEKEHLKQENNLLSSQIDELTCKQSEYEKSFNTITSNSQNELVKKIAEQTKRVALLDVNLIKLSRKYDCLQEDEKVLRASYHQIEQTNIENQEIMLQEIYRLREWKTKASHQLTLLLNQVKTSFPQEDKDILMKKFENIQEKYTKIQIKNSENEKQIAIKESSERKLFELQEIFQIKEQEECELLLEMEIIKKRLEKFDPIFAKFQNVFKSIAENMKKNNISPLAQFQMFDKNNDGKMNKKEFQQILNNLEIKIQSEDIDSLFMFIDIDGSGNIDYKEFLSRLKRNGVLLRNKEDELVYTIYKSITDAGITLKQAFTMFDQNGDNMISLRDMQQTFINMGLQIPSETVERVFKMADVTNDQLINYDEFYRLFEVIVKNTNMEIDKNDQLDWKMNLILKIKEGIVQSEMTLQEAFTAIDTDGSGFVDLDEFQEMFRVMELKLQTKEIQGLFKAIDRNNRNQINFNELQNYIREAQKESERIKKIETLNKRAEQIRNDTNNVLLSAQDIRIQNLTEASRYEMKISIMEQREINCNKRIENLTKQIVFQEDINQDLNKQLRELESSKEKQELIMQTLRDQVIQLNENQKGVITKNESEFLRSLNQQLESENNELRQYQKSIQERVSSVSKVYMNLAQLKLKPLKQVQKSKEMKFLKQLKSKVHVMKQLIKDLQGDSDEKSMIGKLYYGLMVSQWNEATVNKKFEETIDKFKSNACLHGFMLVYL